MVDTAPMESEVVGEGINADISVQLMAGLNLKLMSDEWQEVNVGEDFSQKINAPHINHIASLGNDR